MIAAIGMLAWPQHVLWHETYAEMYAEQVMDQTTDVLYTLAPDAGNATILRATDLRTGRARRGSGSYKQDGLVLAGGYLWVYGGNVLEQVDPGTLATIRSVDLSAEGVADGPAGAVWVGESRGLVRVSVRTGAVLGRAGVPAGMDLDDVDGLPGSG